MNYSNNGTHEMPNLVHHVSEATTGIATKTSIGTGIGAMIIGGIGLQDWLMIVGILTTVGTFAINWIYQHKRSRVYVERRKIPRVDCNHDATCDREGKR